MWVLIVVAVWYIDGEIRHHHRRRGGARLPSVRRLQLPMRAELAENCLAADRHWARFRYTHQEMGALFRLVFDEGLQRKLIKVNEV